MARHPELAIVAAPLATSSSRFPARPTGYHLLCGEATFRAHDCICHHGADSPRSEGTYPCARIGVMLGGVFHTRSRQGAAVVGAGAMVLGNPGAAYEYRHFDDGGDRSIVFDYEPAVLEELGQAGFRRPCAPPSAGSASAMALARHALCSGDPEDLREAALVVAAVVVAGERGDAGAPSATVRQARRISHSLRYIEAHFADDCSLDVLAAQARLSHFHFLRVFRATTGQTPRQIVIATRLRAAASALRATRAPILDVALDVGFGDLSHFTTSFTRAFGVSPRAYRRR
ncbi:MAG: AraC family transcriptional regulator [Kofleriaceae bacterium]